jgi:hypothetical protein
MTQEHSYPRFQWYHVHLISYGHATTSNPKLRADPAIPRATFSNPNTFMSSSCILIFAISYICLTETRPTIPAPAASPFPGFPEGGAAAAAILTGIAEADDDEALAERAEPDGADAEPFATPADSFRRCATGVDRVVKENVRSGLIVIRVGVGVNGVRWPVLALLWRLHIPSGMVMVELRCRLTIPCRSPSL